MHEIAYVRSYTGMLLMRVGTMRSTKAATRLAPCYLATLLEAQWCVHGVCAPLGTKHQKPRGHDMGKEQNQHALWRGAVLQGRPAGLNDGLQGMVMAPGVVASHARLPVSVPRQWMHYLPLHGTHCILKMLRLFPKLASAGCLHFEAAAKPRIPTAYCAAQSCPLLCTHAATT